VHHPAPRPRPRVLGTFNGVVSVSILVVGLLFNAVL